MDANTSYTYRSDLWIYIVLFQHEVSLPLALQNLHVDAMFCVVLTIERRNENKQKSDLVWVTFILFEKPQLSQTPIEDSC